MGSRPMVSCCITTVSPMSSPPGRGSCKNQGKPTNPIKTCASYTLSNRPGTSSINLVSRSHVPPNSGDIPWALTATPSDGKRGALGAVEGYLGPFHGNDSAMMVSSSETLPVLYRSLLSRDCMLLIACKPGGGGGGCPEHGHFEASFRGSIRHSTVYLEQLQLYSQDGWCSLNVQ
jgi:hypothetical protein